VAGVGLAHYVETLVSGIGIRLPDLSAAQLESKRARAVVNLARAFGLTVGCVIGMFPLLFFESPTPPAAAGSKPETSSTATQTTVTQTAAEAAAVEEKEKS
jgi:hypothetical protein